MPFEPGDWICRSCWKSNRPQHTRCYGCKEPRGFDPASGKVVGEAQTVVTRGDLTLPAFLVVLPAIYLRLTAILSVPAMAILGIIFLASLPAAARDADGWVVHPTIILGALFAVNLGLVVGMWIAARAIGERRRWGYVVAILVTAPQGLLALYGAVTVPFPREYQDLAWVQWVGPVFYLPLAVIATVALVASLTERRQTVTT